MPTRPVHSYLGPLVPLLLNVIGALGASGADWPQFLGPGRDGRSAETIVPTLPSDGPSIAWKTPVGSGFAGPAVAAGRVILFHREGGDAIIEAFGAADGRKLWRHVAATGYRDDFGFDNGPRSTPTISDDRVFAYGADGRLTCVEAATGKLIWTKDLAADFEASKGWFGRCCSPLVTGGRVIVNIGGRHDGHPVGVAAFEVADGRLAWTGSTDEASYSSPIATRLQNQSCAVFFTRKGLEVIDPATGRTLAREPMEPDISASVSACTPVVCGPDQVFLSGCYGMGARVWQAGPALALKTLWAEPDRLDCHYGTPVFLDGHLYGFHGRQEQGQELRCIDAATGAVAWSTRLPAGSVLAAGRTLVVLTEKGELILCPATPKAFEAVSRGQILAATTRAFPALSNGLLYARDGRQLVAVRLTPP